MIYVDIQIIRECIIYELLKEHIDNNSKLNILVENLPQNQLT